MRLVTLWTSVVLLVAAAGLTGCQVSADRAGGKLAPAPAVVSVINTRGGVEMQPFVDEVSRLSHGHLVLQGAAPKWHLHQPTAEPDAIEAVAHGQAALGLVPARAFDSVGVTSFDALTAPLLVDSLAFETKVLGTTAVTSRMLAGVEPLGLTGLGILPGPMRKPVGLTRPLVAPRDYRGARIAMSASVIGAKVLETLGAVAVPSPFEGASMTGFDGVEQQTESVAGNQYDVSGSTITANVNLSARSLVLFANTAALKRLSAQDQQILRQAAATAVVTSARAQAAMAAEGTTMLCRRGNVRFVVATTAQVAALRSALAPVTAELRRDPATAAELAEIGALRAGYENAANAEAPVCLTSPSEAVTGDATSDDTASSLDGTYTVTTSPADGEDTPENWGRWVYLLDRGRLAFTQENATACTWGYGRYAVRGQQMVWDISGGGGLAPSGAANKPGEHFVFSWSLYNGVLTLGPVTPPTPGMAVDDISPSNFRARPWHRVGATPSPAALSKRCPPPAAAFGPRSPVDGTWRTTFTKQALASTPLLMDSDELNDDNWGTLTLSLRGDSWTMDQRNRVSSGHSGGPFTVAGDVLTMRNEKGEVFTMRWSTYRNQLILRRDASLGVGPTPLVLQPYTRLGP
jgi:TRAP-type transport system periplasmic protein